LRLVCEHSELHHHMVTVYVLRHGERADKVDPNWRSAHPNEMDDPPLTDYGKVMGARTGTRLSEVGITHIYCSPFHRTLQTAEPIAQQLKLPVCVEHGLAEAVWKSIFSRQPVLTYRLDSNRMARDFSIDKQYISNMPFPKFPERHSESKARYVNTLQALLQKHAGTQDKILLVTHGDGVKSLHEAVMGWEYHGVCDYCCLSEYVQTPAGTKDKKANSSRSSTQLGSWYSACVMNIDHLRHECSVPFTAYSGDVPENVAHEAVACASGA